MLHDLRKAITASSDWMNLDSWVSPPRAADARSCGYPKEYQMCLNVEKLKKWIRITCQVSVGNDDREECDLWPEIKFDINDTHKGEDGWPMYNQAYDFYRWLRDAERHCCRDCRNPNEPPYYGSTECVAIRLPSTDGQFMWKKPVPTCTVTIEKEECNE